MRLGSRTVGVAQGKKSRLHQLREEDVLPDQNKLCVFLSTLTIWDHPSIHLLHYAEDWNHQTCMKIEHENTKTMAKRLGEKDELVIYWQNTAAVVLIIYQISSTYIFGNNLMYSSYP